MINDDEELITEAELCEYARVTRNTLRAWRKAGKLKYVRMPGGRGIRYRRKHVLDLLRRGEER